MMLDKEAKESLPDVGSANRVEYITFQSRKRGADNNFQYNKIMKCSRPLANKEVNKLHGTPYFKVKGYFEENNLNIGERNNCKKVNIPCLTVFGATIVDKHKKIWTMRRLSHTSTLRF